MDICKTSDAMTPEREGSILEGAIETFGTAAQILKAIEELADAYIMLNQLQLIYGDVTEIEIGKLERLERMILEAGRV